MKRTVWNEALEQALKGKGNPVFEWPSGPHGSQILSGANLWMRALELRRELRRQGFGAGSTLCVSSLDPEFIETFVACSMLGGRFWPIKPERAQTMTEVQNSLVHLKNGKQIQPAAVDWFSPEEIAATGEDSVLLLETSGTSGRARLVGFRGEDLILQAEALQRRFDIQEGSVRLIGLPFHHCFGMILDLIVSLLSGQVVYVRNQSPLKVKRLLSDLIDFQVEHLSVVPRFLELMLKQIHQEGISKGAFRHVQLHVGGATVSDSVRVQAEEYFGRLVEGYGLTECAAGVLLNGVESVGQVELRPIDQSTLSLLWVKSPTLGSFFGKSELVDERGFYPTGDLAYQESNGRIRVIGRQGEALKAQNGCWTTSAHLQEEIRKTLDCVDVFISRREAVLQVYYPRDLSALQQTRLHSILQKRVGEAFQLHALEATGTLLSLLEKSNLKSPSDAIAAELRRAL